MISVNEIFESVQGEGASAGVPSVFLRLALCNLRCTFCDTPYTWDFKRFSRQAEVHPRSLEEVAREVRGLRATNLVVTGGEPLLQREAIEALLEELAEYSVEVETAGTLAPGEALLGRVDQWNVSPKLENSGNLEHRRLVPEALAVFAGHPRAWFKFVIVDEDDVREVDALVARLGLPAGRVILMPEGRSAAALAERGRWLAEQAIERGYRYGHRLHVVLFGDERGT